LATLSSGITNYLDTNLTATTEYYYRIKAHNYYGESAYAATNAPPTAEINSPTNLTAIPAGFTNTISVTAADPDGSVTNVEFFANTVSLGSDTNSPYSLDWVTEEAGTYSLRVKVTDDQGNTRVSDSVSVTVDLDTDGDGLSDLEEMALGTDINDADSDDDGLLDGEDAFPLDEYNSGDSTPPDINLEEPADATLL
jgi:hypothetical protein